MIWLMLRRLSLVLLLVLCVSGAARAQSSTVFFGNDLRIFTVMTALNAAGFDVELGSQYHPVRVQVRNLAKSLDPDLVQRLKAFYQEHKRNQSDEAQLSRYISLAVTVTDPPDFKVEDKDEVLPPDVRDLKDFSALMREVFLQARLTRAWSELRPRYDAEIERLGPSVREHILITDAYLRLALGAVTRRSLDILVEMAAPLKSVGVTSSKSTGAACTGIVAATPKTVALSHERQPQFVMSLQPSNPLRHSRARSGPFHRAGTNVTGRNLPGIGDMHAT